MKISWTTCAVSSTETAIIKSKGSCNRCGRVRANKLCKLCQVAAYCCKECYAYDWKHGGHNQICGILKEDAMETSMATMREVVRELYDREMNLLSMSKGDDELLMTIKRFGLTNVISGEIALVLIGRHPCFPFGFDGSAEAYYKIVLRPWYQKYEKFLRSEGFHLSKVNETEELRAGCILKNKRSPLLHLANAFVMPPSERSILFTQDDRDKCYGTWSGSTSVTELEGSIKPVGDMALVGYAHRDMKPMIKFTNGNAFLRSAFWLVRAARPGNSKDVGTHFAETRASVRECLGFDLTLKIGGLKRWPDNAIVETWLAAADGKVQILLKWLDSIDNDNSHHNVISKGDLDVSRLIRLKNLIRKQV